MSLEWDSPLLKAYEPPVPPSAFSTLAVSLLTAGFAVGSLFFILLYDGMNGALGCTADLAWAVDGDGSLYDRVLTKQNIDRNQVNATKYTRSIRQDILLAVPASLLFGFSLTYRKRAKANWGAVFTGFGVVFLFLAIGVYL
ncbi:uncharacterized protein EV422DRAFT_505336 [Fimicolochytrium jonesii]|uniref:uncharacterized protein n=1 Tax=Fimicolochytrium jonesii TaxID=1396493 RepID=UPI0022FDBCFA|nr:uncharacterized protein EV422DRAFT_505336 [Fimicolochytrium jonesii]KAI8822513.1 hypothetical protein EV422DRAFT_505336 [Fimicolochytrium jonesii]